MRRSKAFMLAMLGGGLAFMALLFSCREMPSSEEWELATFPGDIVSSPRVKVAIRNNVQSATLAVCGAFKLFAGSDETAQEIRHLNSSLPKIVVTPNPRYGSNGLLFKAQPIEHPAVTVIPDTNGDMVIDGVTYYGSATLIRNKDGTLTVVNNVSLDPYYVAGVLYAEVPWKDWNEETLKAQAIASRTYAMYEMTVNKDKPFHLVAGSRSQEFAGGFTCNVKIARAVNATLGVVMTWKGALFPAYFHSSCGGHTEDASYVHIKNSITPLAGVPCGWCGLPENRFARWGVSISNEEIARKIGPYVYDNLKLRVRGIRGVEVVESGVSKRAVRLRVIHALRHFDIDANVFRTLIGPTRLPSTNFVVKSDEKKTSFEGRGWGHGVGMCQWGAEGMARAGKTYREIIKHYYPGSELVRLQYQ